MYRYTIALLTGAGRVIDWFGTNDGAEAMAMEDRFLDIANWGETVVLKEGSREVRSITL